MTLTVGSLFAGIGGFDLGFERAGMRTVWFCEQDPYCQAVLAKHWPGVPCYPDVRALVADAAGSGGTARREDAATQIGSDAGARGEGDGGYLPVPVPSVDVLCGGFPCQDLSSAGKQAGLTGERSGLWFEYLRLVGELRPSYVVVENVPMLRKYLGVVTGGLAEIGYDAEWDVISAADFGAPHLRKRLWLVAYPNGQGEHDGAVDAEVGGSPKPVADAESQRRQPRPRAGYEMGPGQLEEIESQGCTAVSPSGVGSVADWLTEPDVGRVAHGVPARVDRLRALGNALVPQIAEYIGRRIVACAS